MRIAMISPLFESVPPRLYGGTERVVYNLCRGLKQNGIEIVLFSSGDSNVAGEIVPVVQEALRLTTRPIWDPYLYNFKMLSLVAHRADEFDLIHSHHDYWMLPLTEITSTPVLTTLHGRLDIPDLKETLAGFSKSMYISISNAQRSPMPSHFPWVKTIHHGIDLDNLHYHEQPGKYLAFLGRMAREKRPEWAVEIAKRSGIPLKIAAKIEGTKGQSYYDTFIKPHVDGQFIEYIGEISETEKSDFLGNALALCFPIDWPEPFGLVVIESLACGTPVLARPCGSMPELLQDGITGYMDFSLDVLVERAHDISKINRKACREWAENRFSFQRMTEDYLHVYRHVTSNKSQSNRHRWNFLYPVQRLTDGNS